MKKLIYLAALVALITGALEQKGISIPEFSLEQATVNENQLHSAFLNRQSNIQIQGEGIVVKILPDDLRGSRHQRFILNTNNGQTVLIAHNIDLAPKINNLKMGDIVDFYGEYEWNAKGGVIHWTHHDPKARHSAGWLKHKGETYQ